MTEALYPAPWDLVGNGLIIMLKGKKQDARNNPLIPASVRDSLETPLSLLMLVNYHDSNAGPYHELLYVPGTAKFGARRLPTISNIWVSSMASVVNGRRNWGIPKEMAQFEWQGQVGQAQHIKASNPQGTFFEIGFKPWGPTLPVNTAWVPGMLKTLGQELDGQTFVFAPLAKGKARPAKIEHLQVDATVCPHLQASEVIGAFEIPHFEMRFPVAQTSDLAQAA